MSRYGFSDIEEMIARENFRGKLTRADLETPALLLDLDAFESEAGRPAYAGHASHYEGFAERRKASCEALVPALETRQASFWSATVSSVLCSPPAPRGPTTSTARSVASPSCSPAALSSLTSTTTVSEARTARCLGTVWKTFGRQQLEERGNESVTLYERARYPAAAARERFPLFFSNMPVFASCSARGGGTVQGFRRANTSTSSSSAAFRRSCIS